MVEMHNYMSYGGGVNSVAMYLLLAGEGSEFEPIFVNHGTDYPETYEYFEMFSEWIDRRGYPAITVLRPAETLYDYSMKFRMVPSMMNRWCTRIFKLDLINGYIATPCFQNIGIDWGERKRAKISTNKGVENRYPLIEHEIDREGCKEIIRKAGLPVPMKSGCFICPYQRVAQWKYLRREHPDLFCRASELERINIEYRKECGKKPLYLNQWPKATLGSIVDEKQMRLFEVDEYPPCACGL
jgi:hypothetical protein